MKISLALVGDYNKNIIAHQAIPRALDIACKSLKVEIAWAWVDTTSINQRDLSFLEKFSAIWAVPGSPYASMEGALKAIRFARENQIPFLGTCGGFQHALIEYARQVLGERKADHAETNPQGLTNIVTPLACSLVENTNRISFKVGSLLNSIFRGQSSLEGYHCNYGLNPEWTNRLEAAGLYFSGFDANAEVRAFELPSHPFFIGTLFQPERSALRNENHPLITAFIAKIAI